MNAEPMRTIQCLSCGITWRAFERNGIWHGRHPINACPGRGTHVCEFCDERYGVVHSVSDCPVAPQTWDEWVDRAVSVLSERARSIARFVVERNGGMLLPGADFSEVDAVIRKETHRVVEWWRTGPHEPPAGAQVLPHGDWLLSEALTCPCPCGCERPREDGKETCWGCWASVKRHEERLRASGKGIIGALSAHVAEQQERKVRTAQ